VRADRLAAVVETLPLWLPALIAVAAAIVVGWLARYVFARMVLPGIERAGRANALTVARAVRGLIFPASLLLGLQLALSLAPLDPAAQVWGGRALSALLLLVVTMAAGRVLARVLAHSMAQSAALRPLADIAERVGVLVIWALGVLMALSQLNVDITPLLTTLGVAGLATALALQDTLANFFAGLYILADRPLKPGDYVKLDSGAEGYVVEVGWRNTKLRQLPNNLIIVPNQKVAQAIITNYHLPETRMSVLIPVSVSYSADPDHVERVLLEEAAQVANEIEGMLTDPPPVVRFIPGFGDSALQFTLICQVREFVDQYLVQHELRKRILRRFRAEGIEIPFPQRTLHLGDGVLAGVRAALQSSAPDRDGPGG
jgi:small-conductance mechanosensitive channel